jgi:UDP-N-acetylmuramoyl-tripeptide--D-alanyl-D-alanine ligase
VAILGDKLELGPAGEALHRAAGRSLAGRVDAVLGVGPLAAAIVDGAREAGMAADGLHHVPAAADAVDALPGLVKGGDAVLVKASRGVRLEAVVDALAARFRGGEA